MQERVRGKEYDELIDELIEALRERYGASFILHWEDFNVRNSFRLLDKYVAQVCPSNMQVLTHLFTILQHTVKLEVHHQSRDSLSSVSEAAYKMCHALCVCGIMHDVSSAAESNLLWVTCATSTL